MEIRTVNGSEIDARAWNQFVSQSPQGAIYHLTGYMDVVAPGWELIEVRLGGKIIAGMPIHIRDKALWQVAMQPPFTQYWGILFADFSGRTDYREFSQKRKIVQKILDELSREIDWFAYGFSPRFDYPIPFHWRKFKLSTRYTFQIDLTREREEILQNMDSSTRRMAKSSPQEGWRIQASTNADGLVELVKQNHESGKKMLSEQELALLPELCQALHTLKCAHIMEVRDEKNRPIAAILTAFFRKQTTYLLSAVAPEHRKSDIMTRLLWETIDLARSHAEVFDFEGSMIEGIEKYFRGFGARPVPYLYIHKNELPLLLKWLKKLE